MILFMNVIILVLQIFILYLSFLAIISVNAHGNNVRVRHLLPKQRCMHYTVCIISGKQPMGLTFHVLNQGMTHIQVTITLSNMNMVCSSMTYISKQVKIKSVVESLAVYLTKVDYSFCCATSGSRTWDFM